MNKKLNSAVKRLVAAFNQQQSRRPLRDDDTLAVYYGDLRELAEAIENKS